VQIDQLEILHFNVPIKNYVFFIHMSNLDNVLKVVDCSFNLGFNHRCIDVKNGSL